MADKRQLLSRYWHYKEFRPCQEEIIDSVLQGQDVFALMPTGGGKSLCYQLPALMMEGMCLVVSPLIALMKDQVEQLNARHLKASCLYSGLGANESSMVLNNAVSGSLKYLYVSPERLRQRSFIEHFRRMNVGLIAVDEAHCVSQWGYDFRPPYLQIAEIRQYQPKAVMIALTATATPTVVKDVCQRLQLRSPRIFSTGFGRPNLAYIVSTSGDKMSRLVHICQSSGEGSGIVYAGSRRRTESLAAHLKAHGISAVFYHAGLSAAERDQRQSLWMNGGCRVIVATNAFGMGIDKADVRFVVHIDAPSSLEAYYQEAGRAGRDGNPAKAMLLCDDGDIRRLDESFSVEFPSPTHIRNTYRALCNYYRIPMGSGQDTTVDFDIEGICSMYNLSPREFYSCCRYLEREGLVSMNDSDAVRSQLYIPIGRDELYRFQVDHMRMGDLLMAIIRLYPGLFTERTTIEEKRIASQCMVGSEEVRQMLKKMNDIHVVEYFPSTDAMQLTFCTERIDERSICLNNANYDMLKTSARERIDAMVRYMANDSVCRSRQLRAYFGETEGVEDCGQCDVCLKATQTDADVEQAVLQAVAQGRLTVGTLCELLGEQNYMEVEPMVRRMLDRGELQLDKNLFLRLS